MAPKGVWESIGRNSVAIRKSIWYSFKTWRKVKSRRQIRLGQRMFKQRILVQFSVKGDVRFVSHHDLMRVLGRAARRAGLPVAMSEGFNPRPRISLLLARGVGVASDAEFAEFDLSEWLSAGEVSRRLGEQLPEGLRVERAEIAHPNVRHTVTGIDYRVDFRSDLPVTADDARRVMESREVLVERERKKSHGPRETKRIDIRPLLRALRVDARSIEMSLAVTPAGTTRVEEVAGALGLDPERILADGAVTRTRMELATNR